MLPLLQALSVLLLAAQSAHAFNFPFEAIQLKEVDVANNSDLAFGKLPVGTQAKCKTFPGDANWPSAERWSALNASLGGALVKGIPPAAACYDGPYKDDAKCTLAKFGYFSSNFLKEDPTVPYQQWTLGNPCPAPSLFNSTLTNYTCKIESFPAYVVIADTVKHVQLAVNFARNNNIRLTIKNTGHDWLGRGPGGGALQVWTHHLKAFEYLPEFEVGKYKGQAARVGSALEQYELMPLMEQSNITLLAPGSTTVGAYGGFMQGGGFAYITSKLGLMADQVLALEVVTADGKFVHADPETNEDLFWAIRGGGPSNFGIVTSAIVKAYPPISFARSGFGFQTTPVFGNTTTNVQVDMDTFWKGIRVYFSHLVRINDAKGVGWNNLNGDIPSPAKRAGKNFAFMGEVRMPAMTAAELKAFVGPIIKDLNAVGINITNPNPDFWETYPKYMFRPQGPGEGAGNSRFVSRLLPRSSFIDPLSSEFNKTMAAIRTFVEEGGYSLHSVDYHPSYETAGYPGNDSAVNPHLRKAIMHATGFDRLNYGPDTPTAQWASSHERLNSYAQVLRDASPGSGAYMNEADTEEPNFQHSFYGDNYPRLLKIKKSVDPWHLFYAVTAVASDEWEVEGTGGLPTQQGRLCRVGA